MTGRYLSDDLNAEVRQIVRQTMIDVNPDTILLGESTNDATSDFQGDGWHGAMTYANFTRPVWGWRRLPSRQRIQAARRGSSDSRTGASRSTQRPRLPRRAPQVRRRPAVARAPAHHERARHPRHGALRESGDGWRGARRRRHVDDVARHPEWCSWATNSVPRATTGSTRARPCRGTPSTSTTRASPCTRNSSTWRTSHVALTEGGIRWLHADDDLLVYIREHADESRARRGDPGRLRPHAAEACGGGRTDSAVFGECDGDGDRGGIAIVGHRAILRCLAAAGSDAAPVRRRPGTILALVESPLPTTIGMAATRVLELAGVTTLEGVSAYTERELLDLHGVGPKAVRILREALDAEGLSFRAIAVPRRMLVFSGCIRRG